MLACRDHAGLLAEAKRGDGPVAADRWIAAVRQPGQARAACAAAKRATGTRYGEQET